MVKKEQVDAFTVVGAGYKSHEIRVKRPGLLRSLYGKPVFSIMILSVIVLGCLFSESFINHDPTQFYLAHLSEPPNGEFFFGTDSLGRDIYSIIWRGGRISIFVGLFSACVATLVGVTYGCVAGMASKVVDDGMMRAVEMMQSIPFLLTVLLIVSITGKQNIASISLVIGGASWFGLARIVRGEVRQIRGSEYVLAARCMGANFPHIMRKHLIPNFVSAIMFVVISSVSLSMSMESTLSFLGFGLPPDVLSWGGMLALADRALLLNTWWVIVVPGLFLVVTLLCVTGVGNHFRRETNKRPSNL
ncbi:MAG: ABC transporter permease [Synergistaceae bacterium]|jgi:peptide/nickel transport system permease protein|nr:ABC transporter permease [Synergistaceae bacterium]